MESDLRNAASWGKQLGLLTVPLFATPEDTSRFVLLNGSRGSFCLDVGRREQDDDARSLAWSSNVGHYVSVYDDQILVQRWDRRAGAESYTYRSVSDNLQRFHGYLEANSPRPELSIISLGVDIFRTLRRLTADRLAGAAALKAFLCMLACMLDRTERAALDLDRWQLDSSASDAADQVRDSDWAALQGSLAGGRPQEGLVPHLDLLLRHASGELFQEAHYEAVRPPVDQLSLDGFLPEPARVTRAASAVGVYYTPVVLVRTVVQQSLASLGSPGESLVVFDPACGSGEFLREAVRQLRRSGYAGQIDVIGWDASESACEMARFALAWDLREDSAGINVRVARVDSIAHADNWPKRVDLLLMNPPFQSWIDMSERQRKAVSGVLGGLSRERPDLSHAFLLCAATSVREDGVVGAVIPASILGSYSARELRGRLSEALTPRLIARLGSHLLFPGAVVDAALYVAKKEYSNQPAIAFWADHRSASTAAGLRALRKSHVGGPLPLPPIVQEGFSIYLHERLGRGKASWAPRPYGSWQFFQKLAHLPRVGDLFHVRQGALTGCNAAFLLARAAWLELPPTERSFFRPAVVNDSVRHGFLDDTTYVFYPYGEMTIQSEEALSESLPQYYQQRLFPLKQRLLARARINRERWWELTWPRAWQVARRPKLVSTYFGDAGSFSFDETGHFAVVHGYSWQPRSAAERTGGWRAIALAYLSILGSKTFSDLLPFVSDHVRGGQWNLSRRFVAQIPMPNLFDERVSSVEVTELSRLGEQILRGELVSDSELDSLVHALYGLDRLV